MNLSKRGKILFYMAIVIIAMLIIGLLIPENPQDYNNPSSLNMTRDTIAREQN